MVDYIQDEPGFKTVTLTRTYTSPFGTTFAKVRLRAPTYQEIVVDGYGEPEEVHPTPGGAYVVITNYQALRQYIDKLAVVPTSEHLADLSPKDTRRVKRAVTDFFIDSPDTKKPQGISSSGADGTANASDE